jgi:serine/threonine protein kinase
MTSHAPTSRIADRFEVISRLEDRGLGESWSCRDPRRAGGVVMVKLLDATGPTLPPALHDLLQRTKHTRHESVLRVHDFGLHGDRPFVAYDLFEGASLGAGLDQARASRELVPLEVLREAFDGVMAAIDAAHRAPKQLLHLGVDPSSVIVRRLPGKPFKVKVLDFGLAAWASPDPTTPKRSARSLRCAAPEAYDLSSATRVSDVFCLGALLREALATPPATGATLQPAGADRFRDDVPVEVWAEIARATSLDPTQRHDSVRALADALQHAFARPVPVRRAPVSPVLDARPAQPPSMYDDPSMRPRPRTAEGMPPLSGPMPALSPTPPMRAPADDTVVLARVAARNAPSPWDLGALRDEQAEAEEEAAAGWLRSKPADDGDTFIAAKPVRPSADPDVTQVPVARKRAWQPVGIPTSATAPMPGLAAPRRNDDDDTVVSFGAQKVVRPVAHPLPHETVPLPAAPVFMPTVSTAPPSIDQTVPAMRPGVVRPIAPSPSPAPTPLPAAPSRTSPWVLVAVAVVVAGLFAVVRAMLRAS